MSEHFEISSEPKSKEIWINCEAFRAHIFLSKMEQIWELFLDEMALQRRLREGNCCWEISLIISFGLNNFEYWTRSSCSAPTPAPRSLKPSLNYPLQTWCGLSNWFVKLKLILWVNNNKNAGWTLIKLMSVGKHHNRSCTVYFLNRVFAVFAVNFMQLTDYLSNFEIKFSSSSAFLRCSFPNFLLLSLES